MSEETKVFESELNGGIKYEIHVSQGFSGRSEIAIKIEGEIVSVISAEVKRGGNIYCRPSKSNTKLIKKDCENPLRPVNLNLDDVIIDDGIQGSEIDNEKL